MRELRVGDQVRLRPDVKAMKRGAKKIVALVALVAHFGEDGAVYLDTPISDFQWWNTADLERVSS